MSKKKKKRREKKKDLQPNDLWGKKKRKRKKKKEEEEDNDVETDDCRLSNRALECDINKAMHVSSGGTWQYSFLEASLFINIPTHLFIYNKTPNFNIFIMIFLKHYIKFNNLFHLA